MIHLTVPRAAAGLSFLAVACVVAGSTVAASVGTGPTMAASSGTPAATPQDHYALYRPIQEVTVRAERESRVRALYANASAETREAALLLFESDRAASTVDWRPSFATLAGVERVLERRGDSVGPDPDADFLAALDLRAVPGVYDAQDEGRGDAITVHVAPVYEVRVPEELVLGLDWVGADGRRVRARTESFTGEEFRGGLEMYVRGPLGDRADWRLEPVLSINGHERIGDGIAVSAVADPAVLHDVLQAGGEGARERPLRALYEEWNRLREWGVRSTAPTAFAERAGHFGLPGGAAWTRAYTWTTFGEDGAASAWAIAPAGEVEGAVVLVRDGSRDATYAFADELEALWKRFADDRGALVVSVTVRDDDADARRFEGVLAALRDQGVGPVHLLVSGDAAILLPRRLRALPDGTVDRVLFHDTPTVARGVRSDLELPVVGLAYGQDEDAIVDQRLEGGGAPRWWVRRRGPDFLTELELPELLGRWLDGALE